MFKKFISVILALSMVMASFIMPSVAFAADTPSVDAQVSELLSRGKYIEHSAIALVKKTVNTSQPKLKSASSVDLVKTSKNIMSVSSDVFEEMSGEVKQPESSNQVQNGPMLLTANSASYDDYEIVLVQNNNMTTAQILKNLLSDNRVAFAEPNYIESADGVKKSASIKATISADDKLEEVESSKEEQSSTKLDLSSYQWVDGNTDYAYGYGYGPTWRGKGTNSEGVVVAVIDSGVDYKHPDLDDVMYHISTEAQTALSCGEFGIDTCNNDTDPMDDNGHGTHCAGSIAAEWNNEGVNGVANGAKLVAVKVMSAAGSGTTADIIEGFNFVAELANYEKGLRVINYSVGGTFAEKTYVAACHAVEEKGIVVCKASGNESYNIDGNYADATRLAALDNTIVVNAMDQFFDKAEFSNYGYRTDLYAPGVGIVSTYPTELQSGFHIAEYDDQCIFKMDDITGLTNDNITEKAEKTVICQKTLELDKDPSAMRVFSFELGYKDQEGNNAPLPADTYVMVSFLDKNSQYHGYIYNSVNSRIGIGFEEGEFAKNYSIDSTSAPGKYKIKLGVCLFNLSGENVYLDEGYKFSVKNISGGVKAAPYETMDGTSMATPFTAGCAAVMCKKLMTAGAIAKANETADAEDAKTLANYVKGSINVLGLLPACRCSQGGNIDLTVKESDYTPVINSVEYDGFGIKLTGDFFGNAKGNIVFQLNQCDAIFEDAIETWNDNEIYFALPTDLEGAGLATITVTKANGKECTVIESVELEKNNLFDKLTDITGPLSIDYTNVKLAAVGDKVYISAESTENDSRKLFVYNAATDSITDTNITFAHIGDIENIGGKLWSFERTEDNNFVLKKYSSLNSYTSYKLGVLALSELSVLAKDCKALSFDLFNVKGQPMLLANLIYEDSIDPVLIRLIPAGTTCTIEVLDSLTDIIPGAKYANTVKVASDAKTQNAVISIGVGNPMVVLSAPNKYQIIKEDVWDSLPETDSDAEFALAMNNNKVYVTALNYYDCPDITNDCDTYVLDLKTKEAIFEPYGNKASKSAALYPAAAFSKDKLYVFYNTSYEVSGDDITIAVMRVTELDEPTYEEVIKEKIEEYVQEQIETAEKAATIVRGVIQERIEKAQKARETLRNIIKGIFSW